VNASSIENLASADAGTRSAGFRAFSTVPFTASGVDGKVSVATSFSAPKFEQFSGAIGRSAVKMGILGGLGAVLGFAVLL
jgi:hypothetical protein